MEQDKCKIVLVVPDWPTSFWYANLFNMAIDTPFYIQATAHPHDEPVRDDQPNTSRSDSLLRRGLNLPPELPDDIAKLILQSWRPSTREQYESFLKRWDNFCKKRKEHQFQTSIITVLTFLHTLYIQGLSYSSLNTARSSISSILKIDGKPAGQHEPVYSPVLAQYMEHSVIMFLPVNSSLLLRCCCCCLRGGALF